MKMNSKSIDISELFENNNFEKWAKESFANDEFSESLYQLIMSTYGDELNEMSNEQVDYKLNEIMDEIITRYAIDEQIVRELNKTGLADAQIKLNNLEINTKKLNELEALEEKCNQLAASLGVPEGGVILEALEKKVENQQEITISNTDDDVQFVDISVRNNAEETSKQRVDIMKNHQYINNSELLSGFKGNKDMPVYVRSSHEELWGRGMIQSMEEQTHFDYLMSTNAVPKPNAPTTTSSTQSTSGNHPTTIYTVLMENGDVLTNINGTQLASIKSALDFGKIYPVGTRIVSIFTDENGNSGHYSGLVAEAPSDRNMYRYLIFFDDGYVQYSVQQDVFLVFQQTTENWKFMNEESQDFVRRYLNKYPERPMLRMKPNQQLKIEYNYEWQMTTVEKIDASLAFVCFKNSHREWIYRGSTRIEALFKELVVAKQRSKAKGKSGKTKKQKLRKPNAPVVEYSRVSNSSIDQAQSNGDMPPPPRKIARKSTSNKRANEPDTDPYVNINISDIDLAGTFISTIDNVLRGRSFPKFKPHRCSFKCIEQHSNDPDAHKGFNPLEIPILCGWFRVRSVPSEVPVAEYDLQLQNLNSNDPIARRRKKRSCVPSNASNNLLNQNRVAASIYYVAPCGRRLRLINDLDCYLHETQSQLTLDLFSFEMDLRVNREFQVGKVITNIVDISYGNENVKVACVNSVDNELPHFIDYVAYRHISTADKVMLTDSVGAPPADHMGELVPLEEQTDYMICCSCTDGCKNKAKCECQQMTLDSARAVKDGSSIGQIGYQNKRLYQYHAGGVFECNSKCSCMASCRNRVVQRGLWNKLQIFKTERKGWGIRTLHDIPRGAFVCIYAGRIYNEAQACIMGQKYGDEYQAELDYIETLEEMKEGYESDVVDDPEREVDEEAVKLAEDNAAKALLMADSSSEEEEEEDSDVVMLTDSPKAHRSKDLEIIDQSQVQPLNKGGVTLSKVEGNVGNPEAQLYKGGARRHMGGPHHSSIGQSAATNKNAVQDTSSSKSKFDIREYLGDPNPFIMDAKISGNLGRYFNHSCSPNLFVQNVFITSHDLRYPEVAFFARRNIESGEEITWDYNYRVGSVKDKVLYCYCGSSKCRGRLL